MSCDNMPYRIFLANERIFSTSFSSPGYPVLIKAAGGGGGKGMKVVEKESDLKERRSNVAFTRSLYERKNECCKKLCSSLRNRCSNNWRSSRYHWTFGFILELDIQHRTEVALAFGTKNDIASRYSLLCSFIVTAGKTTWEPCSNCPRAI